MLTSDHQKPTRFSLRFAGSIESTDRLHTNPIDSLIWTALAENILSILTHSEPAVLTQTLQAGGAGKSELYMSTATFQGSSPFFLNISSSLPWSVAGLPWASLEVNV